MNGAWIGTLRILPDSLPPIPVGVNLAKKASPLVYLLWFMTLKVAVAQTTN